MKEVVESTEEKVEKKECSCVSEMFYPFLRINPGWSMYEVVKCTVLSVFVLPFRLLFVCIFALLIYLVAKLAMLGVKDSDAYCNEPLPMQRLVLLKLIYPLVRAMLFLGFGVYHIKRTIAKDEEPAHVVVANHTGYLDILILLATYNGAFVAKGGVLKTPFVGTIAKALQCLFVVKGESLTERLVSRIRTTFECHRRKDSCPGCGACSTTLIIFPEGTTTNGHAMCAFRTGAFVAGQPVKPVVVRFPYRHFNVSWETIRLREHVWRTMTQFVNFAEVVELPSITPSEAEKGNPRLFARHTQQEMDEILQLPIYPVSRKHKFVYHKYVLGKISAEKAIAEAKQVTAEDTLFGDTEDEVFNYTPAKTCQHYH